MWQIFRQVMRKARTAHECVECDRVIKPGETYEYVSGVWENDFEVIKTCKHCAELRKWIVEPLLFDECPCYGELLFYTQEYHQTFSEKLSYMRSHEPHPKRLEFKAMRKARNNETRPT